MHAHAHKHTHMLRREGFVGRFYFSGEMHGLAGEMHERKGKLVLHNPDREFHLRQKKYKHINSHLVFIREKKKMEDRDRNLERLLDALLPTDGSALAKRKN